MSQTFADNKDHWFNISSCPLRIHVEDNKPSMRNVYLENVSQATVSGFQKGCITEKDGTIRIGSESKAETFEIKSVSTGNNLFDFPTSAHGHYFSVQCDAKSKISIIVVNFADGGMWTIKK